MSVLKWAVCLFIACNIPAARGGVLIESGEKIAFLGDSVTIGDRNGCYTWLVVEGLKANGIDIVPIKQVNDGIHMHTSRELVANFEKELLAQKPAWLALNLGSEDVERGSNGGVNLEDYRKNIMDIVTKTQAAGIKVMILTATMIGEDPQSEKNKELIPYNDFLRQLAQQKNCLFADLNGQMQRALAEYRRQFTTPIPSIPLFTTDGVRTNPFGSAVMARGILTAFGLDPDQIEKARKSWSAIPDAGGVNFAVTIGQYEELESKARQKGKSLQQYIEVKVQSIVSTPD